MTRRTQSSSSPKSLSQLILRLRTSCAGRRVKHPIREDETLDNGVDEKDFKVYLVAHSMGGLVCRSLPAEHALGSAEARGAVDKVFTYATPHNGIDLRVVRNVPGWSALGEATNFNGKGWSAYLGLPKETKEVSTPGGFSAGTVFNLVGTNPADYLVARVSRPGRSVKPAMASFAWRTRRPSPQRVISASSRRARMYTGAIRASTASSIPKRASRISRASCSAPFALTASSTCSTSRCPMKCRRRMSGTTIPCARRTASKSWPRFARANGSCIAALCARILPSSAPMTSCFRKAPTANGRQPRPEQPASVLPVSRPHEEPAQTSKRGVRLRRRHPRSRLQIDGVLWLKKHFEGGYLVRKLIVVEATRDGHAPGGWRLDYGFQSETPNVAANTADHRARMASAQVRDPGRVTCEREARHQGAASHRNAAVAVA